MKSVLGLVIGLLVSAKSSAQGIPVIDAANLVNSVQQVAAWGQQFQQMKNQIDQQRQMFESMNGARGMGDLLNNPALKNSLPPDWQSVYASIQQGGYAGLTGNAKAIRDASKIYDCNGKTGQALALCNRELSKAAQDKAFGQDAYANSQARVDQIQGLMSQINAATDPKAIADLNARIQAENAMIQNEQTKLNMFKMLADGEDKMIAQQKREIDMQNAARKTRVQSMLTPVQF